MTIRTLYFVCFLAGLLFFSVLGTRSGLGLPEASKESVSQREGSTHGRSQPRAGRFWFYHRWGK